MFGISDQPRPYVLDGIEAASWDRYAAYVTPNPESWSTQDPVVDAWLRAHQGSGGAPSTSPPSRRRSSRTASRSTTRTFSTG
ncbi:MAG TPA: hypothetical protein VF576_04610 [Rubricoccaceae bacterium]